MALKVGDLYVAVTANIDGLTKSLKKVTQDVARAAKQVEAFGAKMGEVGAIATAAMAGALLAASQWSGQVQSAMDRVKDTFLTFAAEIGDALLPFLKSVADTLQALLGWFQSLDPHVKTAIASALAYTAVLGLTAGAVGKVAGVVGAMADVFGSFGIPAIKGASKALVSFAGFATSALPSLGALAEGVGGGFAALGPALASVGSAILAIGAPIAAVVAAIVGVIALGGVLYHVYKDNSEAIKGALASAWTAVKGFFSNVGSIFVDVFQGVVGFFKSVITSLLDGFAFLIRGYAQAGAKLASALHLDGLAKMIEPFSKITGEQMANGLFNGIDQLATKTKTLLVSAGSTLGEAISTGVKYSVDGAKMAVSDFSDFAKSKLSGLFGGSGKGVLRSNPSFKAPSANDVQLRPFESLAQFAPQVDTATGSTRMFTEAERFRSDNAAALKDLASQLNPLQELQKHMQLVGALYVDNKIGAKAYYGELISYLDKTSESFHMIHDAASTVTNDLTNGFVNMANGVKGAFSSMVQSIIADLERMAANKAFESLLQIGLNFVAGLFAPSSIDPTGQGGIIGNSPIMAAMPSALRASEVNAPMAFEIHIHQDGSSTTNSTPGNSDTHKFAQGIKAAVKRQIQEEMRPGGDLYRMGRAR